MLLLLSRFLLGLATLIGLMVFDTLGRKLKIEEHGFSAGGSRANFDHAWTDVAMNMTTTIQHLVRKDGQLNETWIQHLCKEAEAAIGPLIGKRRPKIVMSEGDDDRCHTRSTEEQHFMHRHLREEEGQRHAEWCQSHDDGNNNNIYCSTPSSESSLPSSSLHRHRYRHPMVDVLAKLLSEPFLVNVKEEWLGAQKHWGPIHNATSATEKHPNMTPLKFQLKDIVIHHSSNYEDQVAVVVPSSRGDARDLFVMMFTWNWDDPAQYSVGGLATALARFLFTVPWNSRDIVIVMADSKAPYAAGKSLRL